MKSMRFLLIATFVFLSMPAHAEKSLDAHLHGHVKLNVAVDGKTLFVEVHSPSESFLGFEHAPETNQQKSLWASVKNQWEEKIHELIQVAPSLSCEVTKAHMGMHFGEEEGHHHDETGQAHAEDSHHESEHYGHEEHSHHGGQESLTGVHSEIKAEVIFLCRKEIKDSRLVVGLKKHFPNIEEIEVQVLPNSGTPYSKTLTQDKAILDL